MRILFLCHRFPYPPEGGGKIRALHMIRHLAAAGHEVTLCSLVRSALEAEGVAQMRAWCARVETVEVSELVQNARMLLRLPTGKPSSFGYFWSGRLAARVDALLKQERFDLIIAHCSSMGDYVAHVGGTPKIMDFADMDSQKWLDYSRHKPFPASVVYGLEGRKLIRQERRLARAFDVCTTISANEDETLRSYGTSAARGWFPNGVDLEYFAPTGEPYDRNLICFVGRMDYYPNEQAMLWFREAVWPALRERRPELTLRIVGAAPPRSISALAGVDGIEVTGFVRDVREHLLPAALTVAPLRIARGLQNKVLESMAMGIPVVCTQSVASGLGSLDAPVVVADSAQQYVERILGVLDSEEERMQLAEASRAFVEKHFSWAEAMSKLDSIVAGCRPPVPEASASPA